MLPGLCCLADPVWQLLLPNDVAAIIVLILSPLQPFVKIERKPSLMLKYEGDNMEESGSSSSRHGSITSSCSSSSSQTDLGMEELEGLIQQSVIKLETLEVGELLAKVLSL